MPELTNAIVPPGISARKIEFDTSSIDLQTVASELGLLQLGDWEPLDFKINVHQFMKEISLFDDDWVDYLPRTDSKNNRKALVLSNLPGKDHTVNPSQAQASVDAKRKVSENEFNQPTEVWSTCKSLHSLLDTFSPLGRTFLVKCNQGGYFMPHRDHPTLPRDTFRIAVFLNKCEMYEYDWLIDDKKMPIEVGRAYYVNTRKMHRTISWVDNSIHLIINVPFNPANVAKCISHLQHRH